MSHRYSSLHGSSFDGQKFWLADLTLNATEIHILRELMPHLLLRRSRSDALVLNHRMSFSSGAYERPKILLGSKSSTRRIILQELGYDTAVRVADIDEKGIGDRKGDPKSLVTLIGNAKADALLPSLSCPDSWEGASFLVTGDQVVVHNNEILEKPNDFDEVRRNVASYALSPCSTVGSVVVTHLKSGSRLTGVDVAKVRFNRIPDHIVDEICTKEEFLWSAGGLIVEHPLVSPYVEFIEGTIDSVMGLSKELFKELIRELRSNGYS